MTFYHSCFGGEFTLIKLGETPMKSQFSPEKHNRIINAHLKANAIELSATDWVYSPSYEPTWGDIYIYAIYVFGENDDELKICFERLAKGAREERFQELHKLPFGLYGHFYDKFGIHWIFRGNSNEGWSQNQKN